MNQRQIIGVMPNATYRGHINSWDEFCEMIPAVTEKWIDEPASVLGEDGEEDAGV